jgi:hypothetical protein
VKKNIYVYIIFVLAFGLCYLGLFQSLKRDFDNPESNLSQLKDKALSNVAGLKKAFNQFKSFNSQQQGGSGLGGEQDLAPQLEQLKDLLGDKDLRAVTQELIKKKKELSVQGAGLQ